MSRRNLAVMRDDDGDEDGDYIESANAALNDVLTENAEQVGDALADLDRDSSSFLRLPYPSLDAIVGGLAPSDIVFLAAFSGRGKTTFVTSVTDEYVAAGKRVHYMGLESRPHEIRTHLACRDLTRRWYASGGVDGARVDGGDVMSGALHDLVTWPALRKQLKATIEAQTAPGVRDRLIVDGAKFLSADGLRRSCRKASQLGVDVMVIDHIDHIGDEDGGGSATFEESVRTCNAALHAAQEYGIRMLVCTQLNNQGVRSDPLAGCRPPQPHHVYLGPQKRMIATGMLGLYRPLKQGVTPDELKDAKEDRIDFSTVLEPGAMGVYCMKNRKQGRNEGKRVTLGVEHGRVYEINERDKYATAYDARGQRV